MRPAQSAPQRVREIMCPRTSTVRPDTTLEEATGRLLSSDVQELYVTDAAGMLLGIVPDYELLKARLGGLEATMTVEAVMTRQIAVFAPDLEIAAVAPLFRDCRYLRVAVAEAGRLIGQVSRRDVLRSLMQGESSMDAPLAAGGDESPARPQPTRRTLENFSAGSRLFESIANQV